MTRGVPIEIAGQTFGRLTAIGRIDGLHWKFRCSCGEEIVRQGYAVKKGIIQARLQKGWSEHDAITTPLLKVYK